MPPDAVQPVPPLNEGLYRRVAPEYPKKQTSSTRNVACIALVGALAVLTQSKLMYCTGTGTGAEQNLVASTERWRPPARTYISR